MRPQQFFLKASVFPSNALPNKKYVDDFIKPVTCSKCKLGELAYCDVDYHENLATFAYKCNSCNEVFWLTFSPFLQGKKYYEGHVVLLGRHNDSQIKEQFNFLNCQTCNSRLEYFKTDGAIAERLNIGKFSSDILYCKNEKCGRANIFIYWVPPKQYFQKVLRIAQKISGCNEAILTMSLSALEIYFEKIFTFSEHKINGKNKISYQNLQNVNGYFKNHFELEIIDKFILKKDWDILCARYSDRHSIVHRGCYSEQWEPVYITTEQIEELQNIIREFIAKINDKLEAKYLF